jgi:hypothetical protein
MTKPTPPQRWRDALDNDTEWAREMLMEHGALMPMFIMHHRDRDEKVIFMTAFKSEDHKHAVFGFMTLAAIALDVPAVTMITEAWMKAVHQRAGESDKDTYDRALGKRRVSDMEDKVEVLMVSLMYRAADRQEMISTLCEMLRSDDGKISGFKEREDVSAGSMAGAISDILSAERPEPAMRVAANALMLSKGAAIMEGLSIEMISVTKAAMH